MNQPPFHPIEFHGFKWPRRPTYITQGVLLGEDRFGTWLGFPAGTPWRWADNSRSGIHRTAFVKVVPPGDTYWTACFLPGDLRVDVDISFPVRRSGDIFEEIDLELDVLRYANSRVETRDQDLFAQVRREHALPDDIARRAETTFDQIHALLTRGDTEPFATAGPAWLARFIDASSTPKTTGFNQAHDSPNSPSTP